MEVPLEKTIADNIMVYVAPVLILLGTIGNTCTIIVFFKRRGRNTSTYRYLCALAVSDIIILDTGLLRWWIIVLSDYDINAANNFVCKIHPFIVYFSIQCSSWLLVAVTCERFIGVCLPHRVKRGCTLKTSLAVICSIILVLVLLNSHFLYGRSIITIIDIYDNVTLVETCYTAIESYETFFVSTWHWIHFCVYFAIPMAALLFGNTCIIVKLMSQRKKGQIQKLKVSGTQTRKEDDQDKSTQITLLLVIISIVFFLNTAPSAIYFAAQTFLFGEITTKDEAAQQLLTYVIVNILMYLNSAINFILYFLSGSRFRAEVKQLFLCKKWCAAKDETSSSTIQTNIEKYDENVV